MFVTVRQSPFVAASKKRVNSGDIVSPELAAKVCDCFNFADENAFNWSICFCESDVSLALQPLAQKLAAPTTPNGASTVDGRSRRTREASTIAATRPDNCDDRAMATAGTGGARNVRAISMR